MSTSKKTAREKAAEARAAAEASEKRRDRAVRLAIAGVVLLVLAGIAGAVFWSTNSEPAIDADAPLPAGVASVSSGAPVGTAEKPVLDVYEDFQCPACRSLEEQIGSTLDQLATDGKLRINYHPMNFLDANLGNDSSTLAGSAFGCAIDAGKTAEYHRIVFANQPEAEGTGYTKEQLKDWGAAVGISGPALDTFNSCVDNITYAGWVNASNAAASESGVRSTPTLILDGEPVDLSNLPLDEFIAKIEAAGSAQ